MARYTALTKPCLACYSTAMSKARPQLSPTKHPILPIQTRPAPISALQAPSALAQPTLPQHLSTRPQRQLALLQLQQQVGNQAAQHFLHQTTPATDIQRRPLVTPRQMSGLMVVVPLGQEIKQAGAEFNVPPELIGVIVMHESQASERSLFGPLADIAEEVQAEVQGDDASIGIGQMRISVADQLRQKYPQLAGEDVVSDLLNRKRAVRYVAAQLKEIKDSLTAFLSVRQATLAADAEMDMLALGYNIGWISLRDRNLQDPNFGATIPDRVQTIRGRSQYLQKTTAFLPQVRFFLNKIK